jgi:hypothetical protein
MAVSHVKPINLAEEFLKGAPFVLVEKDEPSEVFMRLDQTGLVLYWDFINAVNIKPLNVISILETTQICFYGLRRRC